jgi:hypothetical protein
MGSGCSCIFGDRHATVLMGRGRFGRPSEVRGVRAWHPHLHSDWKPACAIEAQPQPSRVWARSVVSRVYREGRHMQGCRSPWSSRGQAFPSSYWRWSEPTNSRTADIMRYLVTGAAGFIGSHLAAIDLAEGLRSPLPAEEFRTAFFSDKLAPYTELARLALDEDSPDSVDPAFGYIEAASASRPFRRSTARSRRVRPDHARMLTPPGWTCCRRRSVPHAAAGVREHRRRGSRVCRDRHRHRGLSSIVQSARTRRCRRPVSVSDGVVAARLASRVSPHRPVDAPRATPPREAVRPAAATCRATPG